MRVLQIMLGPLRYNGISVVVMNISKHLTSKGIEVDILTQNSTEPELEYRLTDMGCTVFTLQGRNRQPFSYSKNLATVLKEKKYDIVHIHSNSATAALEIKAVKANSSAKVFIHSHNTTCKYRFIDKLFRKYMYRNTDVFLACSNDAGRWLFENNHFEVINNGIDTERYCFNNNQRDIIRKKYDITKDEIVLGHVGRFNYQKNHEYLLRILHDLKTTSKKKYKLILVGEGELESDIKKQVLELQLNDDIVFLKNIDNVNEVLNAMDVFVFPSRYEGLGIVLIEAQANGLKCIVSEEVPKEAKLTDLVSFVALEEQTTLWIQKIDNAEIQGDRWKYIETIKNEGYDIYDAMEKLREIYINSIAE